MESSSYKFYHVHGFHSRTFLDTYCSSKPEMAFHEDCLTFPMEKLHDIFESGLIKGDLLIDFSIGPLIHHLYSASEYFKAIILLRVSDHCIIELKKWLNARTGAFDWTHTSSFIAEKEGESGQLEEKENRLKAAIKQVVKCDTENENLTDPVVIPQADCLISAWLLDVISKDQDDYVRKMKRLLKLLKPAGHVIILGSLNGSFYTTGEHRFHYLNYDENLVRNVLVGEGLTIVQYEIFPRKAKSDLVDYNGILFMVAYKEK